MFVYEALKGRTWPEIGQEFLKSQPDGYVLLTHEALVAYLAAWLMSSLDDWDGENTVREFLVYSFSPSHDLIPDMTPRKIESLRCLTQVQRATLRSLLEEFAKHERSQFVRELASSAVGLIDQL